MEEWCLDRYTPYPDVPAGGSVEDVEDTREVVNDDERVLRGGSFIIFAGLVRSADRDSDRPDDRNNYVGFRPARSFT